MLEKKVSTTHEHICDGSRKVNGVNIVPLPGVNPKKAIIIIFEDGNSKTLCPYKNSYSCEAIAPITGKLDPPCIYEKNR